MMAWIISQAAPYLIGLVALLGVYWRGKHAGKVDATRDVMNRYNKRAKAIDHADLGIGAGDDERIKRLREFAEKP